MKKARGEIALYYPLGDKKEEWTGGGGAQRRLSFLFSHMNREIITPTLVFRVYGDKNRARDILSRFIDPACNLIVLGSNLEVFMHFLKARYDCVAYANQMVANLPAVYGAILSGSKRLLILVTISYSQWKFNSKIKEWLTLNNIFLSNRIDCLYPKEVVELKKRFPKKIITATPCSLPNLSDWLELSGNVKKEKCMVFASRMVEEKNPMLLLDAVDVIKDELARSGYIIQICGDGPLEENIRKRISVSNYDGIVRFMGRQDMTEIMPRAAAFFSLQENENYPSQSLLEAIACGCFCIATDCGDTGRIVKSEFGTMVHKDAHELGCAIQKVITMTDETREEARKAARQFAEKNFNPQKAIKHYEEVCGELVRS